ncbi:hypothetical protein V6N12_016971 [Hibiscus sabdariffa]|uniref:Uncharacterized protein n=1 Tax=Hibiscus sabdariffa TaxID=183260 RepID=A0ABR2ATU9_9ROSI
MDSCPDSILYFLVLHHHSFYFLLGRSHFKLIYEAVFYGSLGLVLIAWILFENSLLYLSKVKKSSTSGKNLEESVLLQNDGRYLQLSDMRIPLTFVISLADSLTLAYSLCKEWIKHKTPFLGYFKSPFSYPHPTVSFVTNIYVCRKKFNDEVLHFTV